MRKRKAPRAQKISYFGQPLLVFLGFIKIFSPLPPAFSLVFPSPCSSGSVLTRALRIPQYSFAAEVIVRKNLSHNCRKGSSFKHHRISLDASSNNDPISEGGSLIFPSNNNNDNLLSSAFLALDETEKYDAVLTGLCSKILDTGGGEKYSKTKGEEGGVISVEEYVQSAVSSLGVMEQPLNLLQEMNTRGVKASPRCTSALLDTAATTGNVRIMKVTLSLCIQNGSITNFGSLQATVKPLPSDTYSSGGIFGGPKKTKSRKEIMDDLPPVPTDDRMVEISAALLVVLTISTALLCKGLIPLLFDRGGEYTVFTTVVPDIIISTVVGGLLLDNFYGIFSSFLNMMNILPKNIKLPPKESLVVFQGKFSKQVMAGLNRLTAVDTERECQTEAAAFFAAYNLGLPCFGFQPNALEAAVMVFESEKNKSQDSTSGKKEELTFSKFKFSALDPLLSDAGVLKILIWLLAPVAMEKMKHAQLISSDPREASGFLKRLKEKAPALGYESQLDALQINSDTETNDLLQWAYSEASTLIRGNQKVCDDLAKRLAGGASTVGDCIAVLEGW